MDESHLYTSYTSATRAFDVPKALSFSALEKGRFFIPLRLSGGPCFDDVQTFAAMPIGRIRICRHVQAARKCRNFQDLLMIPRTHDNEVLSISEWSAAPNLGSPEIIPVAGKVIGARICCDDVHSARMDAEMKSA